MKEAILLASSERMSGYLRGGRLFHLDRCDRDAGGGEAVFDAELAQDVLDVGFDGGDFEAEDDGDFLVAFALADPAQRQKGQSRLTSKGSVPANIKRVSPG